MMRRFVLAIAACLLLHLPSVFPANGQQKEGDEEVSTHHHAAGMKIIMKGQVVEPVGHFAPDSTVKGAPTVDDTSSPGDNRRLSPVMLGFDENLYLLYPDNRKAKQKIASSVGKSAVVNGTVFPAGSGYIIVVDSLKHGSPGDTQ